MRRSLAADGRELAVVLPRHAAPPLTWQGGAAPVASLGKGFRAPCTTTGSVPAPGPRPTARRLDARQRRVPLHRQSGKPCSPDPPSVGLSGADPTTRDRPAPGPRPPVRRLESRQRAPLDPVGTGRAVIMTGAPEPLGATRAGLAPAVIHLPDLSRPAAEEAEAGGGGTSSISEPTTPNMSSLPVARGRPDSASTPIRGCRRLAPPVRGRGAAAPTERSRLNAQHMAALNRVGNNVNQGVRALNQIALTASAGVSRDRLADEIGQTRELLRRGDCGLARNARRQPRGARL